MIKRIIAFIILVPLAIVIVALAVANRGSVAISFDPVNATDPLYVAHVPLYLLMLALVILGVLIGGAAAWLKQGRWRRQSRRQAYELRRVNDENRDLKRRLKTAETVAAEATASGAALGTARPADAQPQPLPPSRALPPAAA
ncbi:MAG: LapA family protein [Xanthobacteraceae bacterium]